MDDRLSPRPASRWRRYLPLAACLVLAGTWIWAGYAKLVDPEGSVQAVRAFRVLPEAWVEPVAHGLPALEIGLAMCLRGRLGAALSAVLLTVFAAGLVQAWARGLSIDCGCFGGGGDVQPAATRYGLELARDLGLLALSLWLCFRPRRARHLPSRTATDETPVRVLTDAASASREES
ncbi:MauE/DoxX family redox-associated membrane protein [Streptomyces parvus]|uniref:MauE/DoxX family redox-associated membrane protein n=1 Tax=Streptomyces parvus TaxID=66428 RepID=UPI003D744DC8